MPDKIINDKEIKTIIDNVNNVNNVIIVNNCGCHGMGHVKRVMNYVETLLKGIGAALTFADKIDMQKNRMLRFIGDNYFHENVKHILDINLNVNQENIVVDIITDGLFDYNSLTSYTKMITKPVEMFKYLNRECVF